MTTPRDFVIICANTAYDDTPLGARPLADALSSTCDVLYVDPPFSYATALKQKSLRRYLIQKKISSITPNLTRLIPLVLPGKDRPVIYKITSWILRRKIRKAIKRNATAGQKIILIATAPHYKTFIKEAFNIFWMMDDYASQPELTGINEKVLLSGQDFNTRSCDACVVVSSTLHDHLAEHGIESVVIENGADAHDFIFPVARDKSLPASIEEQLPRENFALYVGGLNARVDLSYLSALAEANVPLVLVGRVDPRIDADAFNKICAYSHVTHLGEIDNTLIPLIANKASVGLVPYADEPFNQASLPLKIPEYLLCGLTVVSTALAFTKHFERDDVLPARTHDRFVVETQKILEHPPYPSQRVMRSSRIAQTWSWETKGAQYINLAH